ncbi:MAG TPA: HAD family hydrolase [Thermoplasmatales archaeon]|nr:HAD family hydrolase [Thermoplasmatales archaeon]
MKEKYTQLMEMNRIISFDLDGTLVTMDYVDAVWLEKIPEIYAEKNRISFEKAKKFVEREYFRVGPEALEWYNIHYWIEKFGLKMHWKEILNSCIDKLEFYPEVIEVIERLNTENELIIISNASKEFIEIEMNALGFEKYFSHVFSAVSNFGKTKKDKEIYEMVCKNLDIKKEDIIHVGDNYEFDYIAPRKAGILSFYLDRKGNENGEYVVKNLREFEEKLRELY